MLNACYRDAQRKEENKYMKKSKRIAAEKNLVWNWKKENRNGDEALKN